MSSITTYMIAILVISMVISIIGIIGVDEYGGAFYIVISIGFVILLLTGIVYILIPDSFIKPQLVMSLRSTALGPEVGPGSSRDSSIIEKRAPPIDNTNPPMTNVQIYQASDSFLPT
jgi:amino acid transporter